MALFAIGRPDQSLLRGPSRDLGAGADLELAADVLHVRLGGARRDGQAARDGLVGEALGDQFRHL
jgi:hypothetical protein